MAKEKLAKGPGSVPNKALNSRVSYLFQAATFLATRKLESSRHKADAALHSESANDSPSTEQHPKSTRGSTFSSSLSRRLLSEHRTVSQKTQIRLSAALKHRVCKCCDTMLIEGETCTTEMENRSKNGKKPWADVLVRKCGVCGAQKRFPVNLDRQKRRPYRKSVEGEVEIG